MIAQKLIITAGCALTCVFMPFTGLSAEEGDLLDQEAALLAEIKQQLNSGLAPKQSKDAQTENAAVKPAVKTSNGTAPIQAKNLAVKENKSTNSETGQKATAVNNAILVDKQDIKASLKTGAAIQQAPAGEKTNAKVSGVKVEDLLDENSTLKSTLMAKEAQIAELQAKLTKQRNDIMLTQTELSRVSTLVDNKRAETLKAVTGLKIRAPIAPKKTQVQQVTYRHEDARNVAETPAQAEKMTPEMTIATVVIDKANLRTGPGTNNSPLMAVSKGTRLAVETRQGEWYRVIAPTGIRAWVSADVVRFGNDRFSGPTRTLRIKGYDSAEEDAIKLIKRSMR